MSGRKSLESGLNTNYCYCAGVRCLLKESCERYCPTLFTVKKKEVLLKFWNLKGFIYDIRKNKCSLFQTKKDKTYFKEINEL